MSDYLKTIDKVVKEWDTKLIGNIILCVLLL